MIERHLSLPCTRTLNAFVKQSMAPREHISYTVNVILTLLLTTKNMIKDSVSTNK